MKKARKYKQKPQNPAGLQVDFDCPGCGAKCEARTEPDPHIIHAFPGCELLSMLEPEELLRLAREIAPSACVSCSRPTPAAKGADGLKWLYMSGVVPVGAMVCSPACLATAVERHQKYGRVDGGIPN